MTLLKNLRSEALAVRTGPARDQTLATAGQIAAGGGNLLFSFLLARIVSPTDYSHFAAFAALYLLVHVVTGSLNAGTARSPWITDAVRPRLWKIGIATSLVLVALSEPIGATIGLPGGLVLALALTAPAAGLLAMERGRLYGIGAYRQVVMTLLAEPALRLSLGLILAAVAGARGAATGVALGGWAALAIAAPDHLGFRWARTVRRVFRLPVEDPASIAVQARPTDVAPSTGGWTVPADTKWTAATFLLFAVVLSQDLLWANRLLPDAAAGDFAVLSTLGGAAAFATSTIPLVLLGAAGKPRAFRAALGWAATVGACAVFVVLVAPRLVMTLAFGGRYADVGALAGIYVSAMALLGIARVIAARLCTLGGARTAASIVSAIALLQAIVIVAGSRSTGSIATATLIATIASVVALWIALLLRRPPATLPATAEHDPRSAAGMETPTPVVERRPRPLDEPVRAALTRGLTWAGDATSREFARSIDTLRWTKDQASGALHGFRAALGNTSHYRARVRTFASAAWKDRTVRVAAALTLIAFGLRLVATRSVWLDEAIAVSQARLDFDGLLEALRYGDVHPPLHSIVLWVVVRVFGTSELAIRLPSIVAGTLLVPLLYAVAREIYGRKTAVIAAGFATIAPFLVWYAQEARMYALFMLFGLAAVWAQIRVLKYGRRADWALYVIATSLTLWTHYFGILQVIVQQVFFLRAAWRRARNGDRAFLRRWAIACFVLALLMIPLMPILRDQLIAYGNRGTFGGVPARAGGELDPGQQQLSIYALLANLVWAVWGYHSDATMAKLVALWPLGMLFILFLLGRRRSWVSVVSVAVFAVPMIALFGIGFFKRDLFELRYFAVAAPLLILLMARVVTAGFTRDNLRVAATFVVAGSLLIGAVDQQLNGANPRIYDFRGALSAVSEIARPGDTVVYSPEFLEPVMSYYAPDLKAQALNAESPQNEGERVILLASFLDKKDISGRIGGALGKLRDERRLEREIRLPRVKVWVFG